MGLFSSRSSKAGGPFRFRVSDSVQVPLRGYLLRLRRVSGTPSIDDAKPGTSLRVLAPSGESRTVRVKDFSTTGGDQTQERLDATGELDVIVETDDAIRDGVVIGIGWFVEGPVR